MHREPNRLSDEDSQAIYNMLVSTRVTQLRHGDRLDELTNKMAELSAKLDVIITALRESS